MWPGFVKFQLETSAGILETLGFLNRRPVSAACYYVARLAALYSMEYIKVLPSSVYLRESQQIFHFSFKLLLLSYQNCRVLTPASLRHSACGTTFLKIQTS